MAFTTVTITNDYDLADGNDPTGTVSFTPTVPMINGPTVVAAKVTERLNIDGRLTITLAANTDPTTTPVNASYLVEESIGGAYRSYYIQVPHDQGSTLELSSLASVGVAPAISFPSGITLSAGDARFLRQANNLSDLGSASTARTNLGLGGAALLAVGTTAGTVAAGNDSRFNASAPYVAISPSGGDDTSAISTAMDTANTAGKQLFFTPGSYSCSTISKTYAPRIAAHPGTVTIQATNTSSWTWNFAGSLGTPTLVSADAVRGAYALTVASTSGLAAGDIVLVADDQASYASQSTRKHGQTASIASIDSGTTLTLQEPLYAGIATASNAFVAKVTAPDRCRISGLQFRNTNSASTGGFLRFTYCRDVDVQFDGEGSGGPGIRLEHVYDFRVRTTARNYYDNAGSSQFGYAVEANGACAHGQVDVHALKVRHAFTCSGIDSTYGEPTDIRVTGVAHGCSGQSFDAHAQGSDIVFADCLSYGARSFGFSLRGRRQHVMGGAVQGGFGGVWLFESAFDNRISGLRISDIGSSVLDASGAGGRGIRAQSSAIGLTVTDCELVNIARDGIRIDLTGSDVSIMNNIFRNCGQQSGAGQSAIHFAGVVTRGRIVSNSVSDNQGSVTTDAAVMLDATNVNLVLRDNDVQTGIPAVAGTGASSGVTRTTFVDRVTPWQPTGAIQSTAVSDRATVASAGVLVSGRLTLAGGLVLPAGQTISNITFLSGGTGAGTPTNQWFCLVDQSLNVLAKTADNTTTAWALNSAKTLAISGGYTPVVDTPAYIGVVVVATTVPTLQAIGVSTVAGGLTPILAATSTTGLTNPASLGSTAGALTALASLVYGYVS